MKRIGLVGGVASGKSFVARQLAQWGARIVDADQMAHQVLGEPDVIQTILDRWGSRVRNDDGQLARGRVAEIVFAGTRESNSELQWLESVLHPRIHERVIADLETWKQQGIVAAVLDAPVLIKAGWHHQCDEILFVDTRRSIRLQRALERGWEPGELDRREALQTPIDEKRRLATFVVDNNGSIEETTRQLEQFWQQKVLGEGKSS